MEKPTFETITKPYFTCKSCNRNSEKDQWCPCPRQDCEAEHIGDLRIETTFIPKKRDIKESKKTLNFKVRQNARLTEKIAHAKANVLRDPSEINIRVYRNLQLISTRSGWKQLMSMIKPETKLQDFKEIIYCRDFVFYGYMDETIAELASFKLSSLYADRKYYNLTNLCIMKHIGLVNFKVSIYNKGFKEYYDLSIKYYNSLPE